MTVLAKAEDAFALPEIDLIVIATPNITHFDLASKALNAGKHVVVDKPFTNTVAEATELINLAKYSRAIALRFSRSAVGLGFSHAAQGARRWRARRSGAFRVALRPLSP